MKLLVAIVAGLGLVVATGAIVGSIVDLSLGKVLITVLLWDLIGAYIGVVVASMITLVASR